MRPARHGTARPTDHAPATTARCESDRRALRTLVRRAQAAGPRAREALELLAFTGPDLVPMDLLRAVNLGAGRLGTDADAAVRALGDAALVSVEPAGTVSVHPSVQQEVVAELPAGARERRVLCLLDALAAVSPEDPWRPERWPAYRRVLAHARAAAEHGSRIGLRSLALAAVLSDLGEYEWAHGLYATAAEQLRAAHALRATLLGAEHSDTLSGMTDLAAVLWSKGDLAGARTLQEEVLQAQRRILGDEHRDTLLSMNNLGLTLRAQGDLAGARALHEEALRTRRRMLGDGHRETLASMRNLALTLRAQGDLAAARALQEQALAIHARVAGDEHPGG